MKVGRKDITCLAVQVKTQPSSRTLERGKLGGNKPNFPLLDLSQDSEMPVNVKNVLFLFPGGGTTPSRAITVCLSLPVRCPCSSRSRSCRSTEATDSGFDSIDSIVGCTVGKRRKLISGQVIFPAPSIISIYWLISDDVRFVSSPPRTLFTKV